MRVKSPAHSQKQAAPQQSFNPSSQLGTHPQSPAHNPMLELQRTIVNHAVLRMLQAKAKGGEADAAASHPGFTYNFASIPVFHTPVRGIQRKLTVSEPDDAYEHEADRVAEQVMRMPEPQTAAAHATSAASAGSAAGIQRACACGGSCDDCKKKHPEDEHAHVQMKAAGPTSTGRIEAPLIVQEVLRSPGQPLDKATREFTEPRFGWDFSHVRVHTDEKAAESARAVQAKAYTVGRDIVFGAGQYGNTDSGRRLLAHELTHVAQQGNSPIGLHREQPYSDKSVRHSSTSPIVRRSPLSEDPIHDPLLAKFRRDYGLPPGGIDPATGERVGPSDAEIKYGAEYARWLSKGNVSAPASAPPAGPTAATGGSPAACKYSVQYANPREIDCDTAFAQDGKKPSGPLCGKRVVYEIVSVSASSSSCPLQGLTVSEKITPQWDTHSCTPQGYIWPAPKPCTIGPGGKLTGCTDTLTVCGLTSDLHYGGCAEKLTQEMLVDGKTVETHTIDFDVDVRNNNCAGTTITRK